MLLPLACLKRYWVSLCSIIRIKSMDSVWSGQNEDICPSIKKSMSKAATTRRSSASCPAVGTDNTVHTYNVILSKKKLPYQEICPLFSIPIIENSKDFRKIWATSFLSLPKYVLLPLMDSESLQQYSIVSFIFHFQKWRFDCNEVLNFFWNVWSFQKLATIFAHTYS